MGKEMIMKKKLLIIVGAGASIEFGLPSVDDVDGMFDICAGQMLPLISEPMSNLYRYCKDAIDNYYQAASSPMLRKRANFEELLYHLNLLVPYCSDVQRVHGSNALLELRQLPEVRQFGHPKVVDGNVLRYLSNALMDALVDHFIDSCAEIAVNKADEISLLRDFLATLSKEFDIGIVTLNYDNVFTQACPRFFTGFNLETGAFEPLTVLRRDDWNFIYHLHGSIHFAMTGTGHDMHAITWAKTPTKGHQVHCSGRNGQGSAEGVAFPTSTIIAGYGKTQQILRQPFRTYYAQVNRLVHEADSLLFLGYGFGDQHLNAVFSEARDRRRPVVVVDWAKDDQDPLQSRRDTWSHQLFKMLPGNAHSMGEPGSGVPVSIGDLKAANEVEASNDPDCPLAVWYNGMLAACQYSNKILSHLRWRPAV